MTPAEFRTALATLGLSVRRAAPELGVCLRTAYGWARGEWPIPETAARLVQAKLRELPKRRKPPAA
jgi:hypothetical protein